MDNLERIAATKRVLKEEDIFIEGEGINRWNSENTNDELIHLEKNLFRYPYKQYQKEVEKYEKNMFFTNSQKQYTSLKS